MKVKNIIKSDLIRVSFLNMIAVFVKMMTGLISVKVVALIVGPSGVALLGQLTNFSNILMAFSTGGINAGVTKYIAEDKEDKNKLADVLSTSMRIVLLFSLTVGAILIFGCNYWSYVILNESKYSLVFLIFGFTIVFYSLNTFFIAVLNGFKEFKKYVVVNIVGSVIGLIFSVVLVFLWDIEGALIASVTSQSIVLFVTLFLVFRSDWAKRDFFMKKLNADVLKKLSHYSLMAIVAALTVPVSQLIIRSYLLDKLSLDAAGLWEGVSRISTMYLMVVTTSLSVYYLPRLSELTEKEELKKEVFKVCKVFVPLTLFSSVFIFTCRDFIISLLFSSEFSSMRDLFKMQLIGDFFKIFSWLLAYNMLAKAKTLMFISTEIIFSVSLVLFSLYFIGLYGILGATMAYALNYFIYFILVMVLLRRMLF